MEIFFDIETVREKEFRDPDVIDIKYGEKANFMPEFNKIVTICVWRYDDQDIPQRIVKNLEWTEEEQLTRFAEIVKKNVLVWHNIIWFDIPFVAKRMLKYQIDIPDELNLANKKPWEIKHIDTFKVWQMGQFWAPWNMDLVTKYLNIPTPKDNIDGSKVQEYYDKWRLEEIIEYCLKDVHASMKIYSYFKEYKLL